MDAPAPSGIVLVDKPGGMTSHDVVGRLRRAAGTRKVGHAGTLDPMATGLLLLGIESSTRLLTYLVGLDKTYTATIRLGERSSTDDADGEVEPVADAEGVGLDAVDAGIARLSGPIEQVPSTYSAIKVGGRRAYDRARSGEEVELTPRPVVIREFARLAERREPGRLDLDVRVSCTSGTYIRALARDLGEGLGVGGHLTALRRTAVGPFRIEDAAPLGDGVLDGLLAPAAVASELFPSAVLDDAQLRDLAHGKRVELDAPDAEVLAALAPDGRLAGLVRVRDGRLRVLVNMPTGEVLA
ncbi:tRNA pseudouridine(55) synthase TruB [Homoserinibacter sp. YIM 151385]|uniref:tRNA pseudouridine(55) synthase TruB n=1 Tax=Homoserinibacter sp. YIM 151385 TaxID=2985506 RepID=UPI0022F107D5|nr:tRNA pseudouridine(55) synthase TruB [Homoserinibacter sp. YIM 151385]WBU38338.1 tRNA pseudouridine(55) synthase TruB [Homoserinibacter sp. YIM 151385]